MVLTVPVQTVDEEAGPSRRTVLRALLGGMLAAIPLAGCDDSGPADSGPKAPDPLIQFYRDTAALLARFEAAITAVPALAARLSPLRDDHRAHLQALAKEIGPEAGSPSAAPPSAPPAPADAGGVIAALLAAEKEAAAAARTACVTAPSYRAALLGSIAAARASHAEVLA
jgi:hypothetical protein